MKIAVLVLLICLIINIQARLNLSPLERINSTVEDCGSSWAPTNIYFHGSQRLAVPLSMHRAVLFKAPAPTTFRHLGLKVTVNMTDTSIPTGMVAVVMLAIGRGGQLPDVSLMNPNLAVTDDQSSDVTYFTQPLYKAVREVVYAETVLLESDGPRQHTINYCLSADIGRNQIALYEGDLLVLVIGYQYSQNVQGNGVKFYGTTNWNTAYP